MTVSDGTFGGSEFASYIALCRELWTRRPGNWSPHEFEIGDMLVMTYPGFGDIPGRDAVGVYGADAHPHDDDESAVWLPRLDQLLAMLEEAGMGVVAIDRITKRWEPWPYGGFEPPLYQILANEEAWDCEWECATDHAAGAPTREEAALRLWLAVTGRSAPA